MSTTHLAQSRRSPILNHAPEGLHSSQMMGEGLWCVLHLLVFAAAIDGAMWAYQLVGSIGFEIEAFCSLILASGLALYCGTAMGLAVERAIQMRKDHG